VDCACPVEFLNLSDRRRLSHLRSLSFRLSSPEKKRTSWQSVFWGMMRAKS